MKYAETIARHSPSQSPWELNELLLELERIDVRTVLEIGMHRGRSIALWRDVLNPRRLVGVNDVDQLDVDRSVLGLRAVFGRSQERAVYDQVLHELGTEMLKVDFLFVDGGHLADEVRRDFCLYAPLVRPGGLVALHDAHLQGNPTVEVHRFWEQVREGKRTKLVWDGSPTGTGVGLIYV